MNKAELVIFLTKELAQNEMTTIDLSDIIAPIFANSHTSEGKLNIEELQVSMQYLGDTCVEYHNLVVNRQSQN